MSEDTDIIAGLVAQNERQAAEIERLKDEHRADKSEIEGLKSWVNDCQAGMYINCVYCGHRYGPADKVACTMQEALYEHIAKCPKHPLSAAKQKITALEQDKERLVKALEAIRDFEQPEVCKDEFAYDRLVETYRDATQAAIDAARARGKRK